MVNGHNLNEAFFLKSIENYVSSFLTSTLDSDIFVEVKGNEYVVNDRLSFPIIHSGPQTKKDC
ncbi:hypothetical protein AS159_02605 [Thermotoga sp. Ku-13t]|nr:hypothetical protein AS159_02605 [Thermotoga sp. Ku-13t]